MQITEQFFCGNSTMQLVLGSGRYQGDGLYHPFIRKLTMILKRILTRRLLPFCCILCMFVYLPSISIASGGVRIEGKKNVLILNSYHQGYKWTDDETQGALTGLDPVRNDFKVVIEYMGTKWAYAEPYFEQLRGTYKYKFQGIRFDMIIATDDDAFNFLKRNRDELFPNTPVVFCGVNWFKPESVPAGFKGYTGVNEDADIPATLDLMLNLHPGAKKVYVVTDMTTTGKTVHAQFEGIVPKYKDRVSFTFLDDMDMSEILDTVGKLGNDSLVLMTIFQKDKAGTFYEFSESTSLISKSSRVPFYGLWDFNLGFGIMGGMLTSGYNQGKTAGEAAVRILKGEKADAGDKAAGKDGKGKFTLQLSSFPEKAEAEVFARKFDGSGMKVSIASVSLPGKGTWWRVRAGVFASEKAALDAKVAIEKRHSVIAYVARMSP